MTLLATQDAAVPWDHSEAGDSDSDRDDDVPLSNPDDAAPNTP